jgi:hypothetical protein
MKLRTKKLPSAPPLKEAFFLITKKSLNFYKQGSLPIEDSSV